MLRVLIQNVAVLSVVLAAVFVGVPREFDVAAQSPYTNAAYVTTLDTFAPCNPAGTSAHVAEEQEKAPTKPKPKKARARKCFMVFDFAYLVESGRATFPQVASSFTPAPEPEGDLALFVRTGPTRLFQHV